MTKYDIVIINIFEESVFDDTAYSVCSFQFQLKTTVSHIDCIRAYVYPNDTQISFVLNASNNYSIGGDIYQLKQTDKYAIDRATSKYNDLKYNTNILVKCIDDNSNNMICCAYIDDLTRNQYIDTTPNLSACSYALLMIKPSLSITQQHQLIDEFNMFLKNKRLKYNSLFLSNYCESNTIARKRISFKLVYKICNHLHIHVIIRFNF